MNPNGLDEESGYQKRRRKHKPTTVADPPRLERHVDRSARKKTAHMIIERSSLGCASDNEEESLFENVYSEVEDEEAAQEEVDSEEDISKIAPDTPSKRGKISASKRQKRSPTPPLDLSPHELYFSQNRPGRTKTSNTNLSSVALLDHEEYFELVRSYKSQHNDDLEYLQAEYAKSFNQWQFELSQGFNICLYGFGSKRSLLMKFAEYIDDRQKDDINKKVVIVNGYVSSMSLIKDTLQTIAAAVSDPAAGPPKLGSQPAGMLDSLVQLLDEDPSKHVTLVLHSIDGPTLRRPTVQAILSRISSFSQVKLIASANHPSFPLLWDSSIRSTFNFVFHDSTTFQPYTSEIDVVDEVNELLGRSSRRVGGKGGVGFVLKSLPEKARKLYEILIQEQLASMGGQSALDRRDDEDDNDSRSMNMAKSEAGIEFRLLYQKAVEEFICSTEMNFRTQLKEFYDHKMIESHFDFLGTEVISIPFKKDELETILEDLTS
ncbi:origin recognition complex subunit 2-domain-containing protein [Calycina marina]|uniref:Origin recognition complex subunit 2 n=1 Tax=Calycina marina TaxID=1763456 RepID=A0A9P8CF50_9HELO|nr:origin recognition complex subunit 2-domain-containing protein [Calycina marina]